MQQPIPPLWVCKAGSQMSQPLSNSPGDVPSDVQVDTPPSMDHPPCVSCITPYPIQRNNRIRGELFTTTPQPYARCRTIRSRDHLQPPMSWEVETIAVSRQVAR